MTQDPTIDVPSRESLIAAELIESCRAHVATITELAEITTRALRECYEYEDDEPQLWHCCGLVRHLLMQVHTALVPIGIVSHETDPHAHALTIEKTCEEQRRLLRPAIHVVRQGIYIVENIEPNYNDQVVPALRDLENGISMVIDGLGMVIQGVLIQKPRVIAG
jgi:hypothetical protein